MELKDAIYTRRSIRKFNDQVVSDEVINEIVEAGLVAPSACNKKPLEYFVVKNKEIQKVLRKASLFTNYSSSVIIVVCGNTHRSLSKKENDFWIQDGAASIQNMLLMATSLDVGSCWCGLYPMEGSCKKVSKALNLKDHLIPLGLIHLGYFDKKKDKNEVTKKDRIHIID